MAKMFRVKMCTMKVLMMGMMKVCKMADAEIEIILVDIIIITQPMIMTRGLIHIPHGDITDLIEEVGQ